MKELIEYIAIGAMIFCAALFIVWYVLILIFLIKDAIRRILE